MLRERNSSRGRLIAKLRKEGISDKAVLQALGEIPRELFLGMQNATEEAYADVPLAIECDQTISQPFIVAYMTEKLELSKTHDVLEIGTGSGYQTAVLAKLSRHVYTMERHPKLHQLAVDRLVELKLTNVTAIVGDGAKGWPWPKLFDRIIVTAAPEYLPEALCDQLTENGKLIIPIGKPKHQYLYLITRLKGRKIVDQLLPVQFVPLLPNH